VVVLILDLLFRDGLTLPSSQILGSDTKDAEFWQTLKATKRFMFGSKLHNDSKIVFVVLFSLFGIQSSYADPGRTQDIEINP
jgi:hypothetical protein